MTLVIDASMALAWIYAREKPTEAECAVRALQAMTEMATVVPSLWHTEIANALLVGERRRIVTEAQTIDYLTRLARLSIKSGYSIGLLVFPSGMAINLWNRS